VQDVLHALAGGAHPGRVLQVELPEVDPVANAGEILEASGAEVVDAPHIVAPLHQRVGQG
jgi:hypothetical protein